MPALNDNGQPRQYDFAQLSDTASTILVKTGSGFLHSLIVTGGTAGTINVFDNIEGSGTSIAKFGDGGISITGLEGTAKAETFIFDIAFQTGLEIETTAVDSPRISISFR